MLLALHGAMDWSVVEIPVRTSPYATEPVLVVVCITG
jgi:hypothetical protein